MEEASPAPLYQAVIDRDNPTAMINLVPPEVAAAIERAVGAHPDLFTQDEISLKKTLAKKFMRPNTVDSCLRLAFWLEYDRAHFEGRKMRMTNVFVGICLSDYFYKKYLKEPSLVAWMVCPPIQHEIMLNEMISLGLHEMRDILNKPIQHANGQINSALAGIKFKIVQAAMDRIKGGVVQRVHTTGSVQFRSQVEEMAVELNADALDKRIANLRSKINRNAPEEVQVESKLSPNVEGTGNAGGEAESSGPGSPPPVRDEVV